MRRPTGVVLGPGARTRLLARASTSPRQHAVYTLALDAGLRCSEIVALDIRDVSSDGRGPREVVEVQSHDGRARQQDGARHVAISVEARYALAAYLAWRRSRCPHPDRPMRIGRAADGAFRCASCGDVADFLGAPLFVGHRRRRLTQNALRAEFEKLRVSLRLGERLHFDSLRATHVALRDEAARAV